MIEMAADELNSVNEFLKTSQQKELHSFGDERAKLLGASGISNDFSTGYALGLQVARKIIQASTEVHMHDADPDLIL